MFESAPPLPSAVGSPCTDKDLVKSVRASRLHSIRRERPILWHACRISNDIGDRSEPIALKPFNGCRSFCRQRGPDVVQPQRPERRQLAPKEIERVVDV